ncbi:MAG TPA: hypothetical protein VFC06_05540 [Demequina sp.]|nr:hypothetical protein [Demequina sp.]
MNDCSAPIRGHEPDSQQERDCPVHGTKRSTHPMDAARLMAPPTAVLSHGRERMELNVEMEFGGAYAIGKDGTIEHTGDYVPSFIDDRCDSEDWEPMHGFTNQYGYKGPVMHASEQLGGGMEDWVWEHPGTYAIVEATYTVDEDGNELGMGAFDDPPEGWVLLRHRDADDSAPKPQSTVPQWYGEFSPIGKPITPGAVIWAQVDGGERYFRLLPFEPDGSGNPRGQERLWVSNDDENVVRRNSELGDWMPSFFPHTEAGDVEHAYRNLFNDIVRTDKRLEGQRNDVDNQLTEAGVPGVSLAEARGFDNDKPFSAVYGANSDGTRSFRVVVARDADGAAQVEASGDTSSRRAKSAIGVMRANADRIADWRDAREAKSAQHKQADELRDRYLRATGERL